MAPRAMTPSGRPDFEDFSSLQKACWVLAFKSSCMRAPWLLGSLVLLLLQAGRAGEAMQHRVEQGQTLASIARRYGLSLSAVVAANPEVDPHRLRVGELIWVPAPTPLGEPPAAPSAPAPESGEGSGSLAPPGEWEAITLADGRRGWAPRASLWLPSAQPLPPEELLQVARRFLGAPYRWGGQSPNGVDCSGFVQEVFRLAGHTLPRLAGEQFNACQEVSEPAGGDLVFFSTYQPGPSHVGIYLGEGRFLHASSSRGVVEDELESAYFKPRYLGARRPPSPQPAAMQP